MDASESGKVMRRLRRSVSNSEYRFRKFILLPLNKLSAMRLCQGSIAAYTQSLDLYVPHDKRAYARPVAIDHRMLVNGDTPRPARIVAVRVTGGVIVQRDAAV